MATFFFFLSGKYSTINYRAQVSMFTLTVCAVRRWCLVAIPNSSLGPPCVKSHISLLCKALGTLASMLKLKEDITSLVKEWKLLHVSKRSVSICSAQPLSPKLSPASPRLCGLREPQRGLLTVLL